MDWKVIIGLFAKPIGAAINNALTAGSAAVIAWSVTKGADAGVIAPIVAGVVNVISLSISGLAATQGVQIPLINKDQSNGVVVVPATSANAAQAVNGPKA